MLFDDRSLRAIRALKQGVGCYKFSYKLQDFRPKLKVSDRQFLYYQKKLSTIYWENLTNPAYNKPIVKSRKIYTVHACSIRGVIYGPYSSTFLFLMGKMRLNYENCVTIISNVRTYDFYFDNPNHAE